MINQDPSIFLLTFKAAMWGALKVLAAAVVLAAVIYRWTR